MDYNKPLDRRIMDMEGLKRWIRPQMDACRVLFEAVDDLRSEEALRVRRLVAIGFTEPEAEELSELHTPNFM
jgi:hypothetical protein